MTISLLLCWQQTILGGWVKHSMTFASPLCLVRPSYKLQHMQHGVKLKSGRLDISALSWRCDLTKTCKRTICGGRLSNLKKHVYHMQIKHLFKQFFRCLMLNTKKQKPKKIFSFNSSSTLVSSVVTKGKISQKKKKKCSELKGLQILISLHMTLSLLHHFCFI